MTRTADSQAGAQQPTPINDVRLQGRLATDPQQRQLPSGDALTTFRLIVDRAPVRGEPRRRVDAIECIAWSARVQRAAAAWEPGDVVHVEGQLRRRFRRTDSGPISRVEVEVARARRVR